MAAELEAWAGHLLIVGGRTVRMPPPGALAETAPRRASRAREGDTFCILITPADDTRVPAALLETLAQLAADIYFGSGGGVTSGLREALGAVHGALQRGAGGCVNALALVLRGSEVYAARSGRMFAAVLQAGELALFPRDRRDPLVMNLPPLGSGPAPELQMARYGVQPGATMLLADTHLMGPDDDALERVLGSGDVPAILEQVKTLDIGELSASVLQFVPSGTPDPAGMAPPPSPRLPREAPPRRVPAPADTAPVPPPAAPASLPEAPPVQPPEPEEPTAPMPIVSAARPMDVANDEARAPEEGLAPAPSVQERMQDAFERVSDAASTLTAKVQTAPMLRRQPAAADEQAAGPSPVEQAREGAQRATRSGLRAVLTGLLVVIDALSGLLERILPEPGEDGRQGIPTNVAVGLAVMIPIVIVVVVVGLALAGYEKSDFEKYMERARTAHSEALELSAGACNNQALRPLWMEVLRLTEQADKLRSHDQELMVIQADAQNYLDCYDNVERRNLTLLREYTVGADLVGPVIHGGIDLYMLDRTNSRVYHDTLNESGSALISADKNPIIWRGQVVSSGTGTYTVGAMIDIEWLPSGGTAHDNVLIALDRSGLLVAYSPTFFNTAQQLVTEARWQDPVAMTVFRRNLYVLDRGANQIWRYVPPAGARAYSNAPEEYFDGFELPDLARAVDLGIDENGAVYVLFDDGTIKKYRRNTVGAVEEQPFNYRDAPLGALSGAVALHVDNDPLSSNLYIVDAGNSTVYEVSWAGTYHNGYRPRNVLDAFEDLQGFYADTVVRNNMYAAAGGRLYHFARHP